MDMFITFIVLMDSQEFTYVKIYQIVHVKNVQFMVHQLYQLYLNKTDKNESKVFLNFFYNFKGPATV